MANNNLTFPRHDAPMVDGGGKAAPDWFRVFKQIELFGAPTYQFSDLPGGAAGRLAFVTDAVKAGESAGNGTGVLAFHDGTAWCASDTGLPVSI